MAGAPLQSSVEVNVKPSAQAMQALESTSRKLTEIQTKARAAQQAVSTVQTQAQALGVSNRFTSTGPALPGLQVTRRSLASVSALRGGLDTSRGAIEASESGVKLGRFGTFGSGGFVLGKEAVLKAAMPVMIAAAGTRAVAGSINGLASFVEAQRKGQIGQAILELPGKLGRSAFTILGGDSIVEALVNLDRASGGSWMTQAQADAYFKQQDETRAKVAQEGRKFEDTVRSSLVSQAAGLSQTWLGRPDAYKLNQRLAAHIESVTTEARKIRERQLELEAYNAGTDY